MNITVSQNLAVLAQETKPSTTGLVLQCILYGEISIYLSGILCLINDRRIRASVPSNDPCDLVSEHLVALLGRMDRPTMPPQEAPPAQSAMDRAHGDHDYDVYHVERMFAA